MQYIPIDFKLVVLCMKKEKKSVWVVPNSSLANKTQQNMKLLLILTVCLSYSIRNCDALKCYEIDNLGINSSKVNTEKCKPPMTDFCVTTSIKNGDDPYFTCGDREFCVSKGCFNSMYCKEPGTYEHYHPNEKNVQFKITCCGTDLCNFESSARTLNKTFFTSIFSMIIFSLFLLCHFVNFFFVY